MHEKDLKEALTATICWVLKQVAFVFPEPADLGAGMEFDDEELLSATLSYDGHECGELMMAMPVGLCVQMYANLIGTYDENSITEAQYFDALGEVLNIITGQLLTNIYGLNQNFVLNAPQTRKISKDKLFSSIDKNICVCCMVEDFPIIATLKIKASHYEHKGISC